MITITRKKKKPNIFLGLQDFVSAGTEAKYKGQPVLITGVGRSGTHFMATLYEKSKEFQSMHLDDIGDPVGDAYNWFCKWYQPAASMHSFCNSRQFLAHNSGLQGKRYMESNPMIAFMMEDLVKCMDVKVIIMVRHPKQVVESHFQKGWYAEIASSTSASVPDYPYLHKRPNHFFSRIMPKDKQEMQAWNSYGTLGKIAWMWMAVSRDIFRQIEEHNLQEKVRLVYLNEFDHAAYKELNIWLGASSELAEKQFNKITESRPGKGKPGQKPEWTEKDKQEFNIEIGKVIDQFNFIADSNRWLF